MLSDCYIRIATEAKPNQNRFKTIQSQVCIRSTNIKIKFYDLLFIKIKPVTQHKKTELLFFDSSGAFTGDFII